MPSEEEMIELLIFNKEDIEKGRLDFKWIHSREFKYNGDMYDIVTKEETDEQLIVHVINDTKEKKLEEEFEKRRANGQLHVDPPIHTDLCIQTYLRHHRDLLSSFLL